MTELKPQIMQEEPCPNCGQPSYHGTAHSIECWYKDAPQ